MAGELIYVSWGGTGRGAALRAAYAHAAATDRSLTYLAVLDPPHFADLDNKMTAVVIDELEWLLRAHVATVAAASTDPVESSRILVRTGEVDDVVCEVVDLSGADAIMLGSPNDVSDSSVQELLAALERRTQVEVSIAPT